MEEAVVVANAPWCWNEELASVARGARLLVAADGGANHLARIGVRPEVVIGDLDSIRPEVRRWIGETRVVHSPDQEHTDLHKALAYVVDERGAGAVTVMAATGGDLDHAMENLGLTARWAERARIELVDRRTRIVAVRDQARMPTAPGDRISLIPMGRCERVWTRGLAWTLSGEPLDLAVRTSISNRATGDWVELRVEGGTLLVFLSRSDVR